MSLLLVHTIITFYFRLDYVNNLFFVYNRTGTTLKTIINKIRTTYLTDIFVFSIIFYIIINILLLFKINLTS